jgi:glycosyltransferase involved in cell wall biosynthesis
LIIAFDTFFLSNRFRNVGIYEYATNLFNEFRRLAAGDRSIDIRYFVCPGHSEEAVASRSSPGFEAVSSKLLELHTLWRLGLVNVAAVRAHAELIFSPSPLILPWGVLPVAVTIHDAIPVRLPPQTVGGGSMLRMSMRAAAKMSQKVLTDSEHSKKDLVEIYNLAPEKVSVVHLGYDREQFNSSPTNTTEQSGLWARLGIRGPYIMHHGMVQLRKNLGKLVEAYSILIERHRDLTFQLVLAGPFGFGSEQLFRAADGLIRQGKVIFTGPLADNELAQLIKGASLCVIPSLYEGFCLPMVEAMACGVPTVAANSSCIPEISGGVLRYFDPLSAEDLATTILNVLQHVDLQRELVENGLKQASQFSWQRCAQETLKVLTSMDVRGGVATTRGSVDVAVKERRSRESFAR